MAVHLLAEISSRYYAARGCASKPLNSLELHADKLMKWKFPAQSFSPKCVPQMTRTRRGAAESAATGEAAPKGRRGQSGDRRMGIKKKVFQRVSGLGGGWGNPALMSQIRFLSVCFRFSSPPQPPRPTKNAPLRIPRRRLARYTCATDRNARNLNTFQKLKALILVAGCSIRCKGFWVKSSTRWAPL